MSLRLLTSRLTKHGRFILQNLWSREIHVNILEQKQNRTLQTRLPKAATNVLRSNVAKQTVARNVVQAVISNSTSSTSVSSAATGIFRFGQHARKIFVDNILNRVTSTYSSELRQQATKKLFYGDSAPFFALIGVSLASGAGVLTKEDELEGVCWEIREAATRLQSSWNTNNNATPELEADFSIDHLDIGAPIAKGCAAVVYAASLKQLSKQENNDVHVDNLNDPVAATAASNATAPGDIPSPRQPIVMTPIQNISRFVHNFGTSVDNLNIYNQRSATFSPRVEEYLTKHEDETKHGEEDQIKSAIETLKMEDKDFKLLDNSMPTATSSIERYPLALKMMFNYDIQSNAISILRAMYKETVPARQRHMNPAISGWERYLHEQTLTLPAHPFIVNMLGFFCDEVRNFPCGHVLYPSAQPQRINPNGYGRNMSLFLLMKRYDFSLRALLDSTELQPRTKLLLFAQLLEAVAHLNRHGIAHRDLKSDNILIEMSDQDSHPILVLSDFGCCLADKVHGLQIPYTSQDMDKGGNAALMAPEIINKQPGQFSVLNYAKADLWACGAIAYEIFGLPNPFYASNASNFGNGAGGDHQRYAIRNENYKVNDLPSLNSECPPLVQKLIFNILNPNPSKRVSPDIAANIMQLFLWAPSRWLKSGGIPNSTEVLQWLLSLTTKLMCEGRVGSVNVTTAVPRTSNLFYNQSGRRTYVEYLLICSFLARARLRRIRGALSWIQDSI